MTAYTEIKRTAYTDACINDVHRGIMTELRVMVCGSDLTIHGNETMCITSMHILTGVT